MNNDSMNSHNQFVISYELLALLQWLVEHDAERLKKIIARALQNGLKKDIQNFKVYAADAQSNEDIQHNIVEFFGLLEALLVETMNEHAMQDAVEKNLMPAIDQLDSTICDDATIRSSVEKATLKLDKSPQDNPQEVLFKEILKRWKPQNKKVLN
ncbi:MAG: hypothetical protein ACHQVS_04340 [Candidatus Babeliales bacterium]